MGRCADNMAPMTPPSAPLSLSAVTLICDGACSGNPGPGGWGVILRYLDASGQKVEKELSGGENPTTNNRMELTAAIQGLMQLKKPCHVTIVTDSEYVKRGVTEWLSGWQARGWKTADKKPVKNQDLWQQLIAAMAPHQLKWQWVKGHAGHPDNERADALAVAACERFK